MYVLELLDQNIDTHTFRPGILLGVPRSEA